MRKMELVEAEAGESCREGWVEPRYLDSLQAEDDIDLINLESDLYIDDEIEDMEELAGTVMDAAPAQQTILRTRTYDLSITYDKYYQTPRLLLVGYDEQGLPLPPHKALSDISQDHAHKTVTLEQHPHLQVQVASIHPCKHAEMMKKFLERLRQGGKEVRLDQYLVVFLKFMSGVIPNIDYDHTISLE